MSGNPSTERCSPSNEARKFTSSTASSIALPVPSRSCNAQLKLLAIVTSRRHLLVCICLLQVGCAADGRVAQLCLKDCLSKFRRAQARALDRDLELRKSLRCFCERRRG